ncbi:TPA: TlpA family protein disulfide reductase [Streptococcus suis]|nr:TlpA family protein disulfide reductase [Streptococcus suis]
MKKRELVVALAIVILLVGGIIYLVTTSSLTQDVTTTEVANSTSQPTEGELASLTKSMQAISFLDENDQETSVKEVTTKPAIVVFWASWCPDCQAQLPILAKLYEKYSEDIDFIFLNVVDQTRETKESGQKYLAANYEFTYYQDKDLVAADSLKVTNIPTMFVLNGQQEVVQVFRSNQTEEVLSKALESVK